MVDELCVADESDGRSKARVGDDGDAVDRVLGRGLVDGNFENLLGELVNSSELAGAADEIEARGGRLENLLGGAWFVLEALEDEGENFAKTFADDLIEDGAFELDAGEAFVIFDVNDADGAGGIVGNVALANFDIFCFGAWEINLKRFCDEMNVVGDVVASDGDAAAGDEFAFVVGDVVAGAGADVDEDGTVFAVVAAEAGECGGDGGKDDLFDLDGLVGEAADAVEDAVFDAVNDVVVGFEVRAVAVERSIFLLHVIERIRSGDEVEAGVRFGHPEILGVVLELLNVRAANGFFGVWDAKGGFDILADDVAT